MSIQSLLSKNSHDLIACLPSERLEAAVEAMVENNLNALAVVDADGILAGILTDHDVMRAVYEGGGSLGDSQVLTWMTREVITCSIETKLTDALKILGQHQIRHIVITQSDKPVFVVGIRQILRQIHEQDELEISVLRDMTLAARAAISSC